jgi:ABC-type branched-subunit amino acid transport system substrate-binding protein
MFMRLRQGAPLMLIGAAASLGMAACGDAAGSAGDVSVIKIRTIAAVGSPLTNYPDVQAASKAAAEAINKAGGINGHKIEYSFCNTRGEANAAMQCARDAVTDKVAAVVGRTDIFAPQTTPILERGKIPDIGLIPTGSPTDVTSPISFPLHGGNSGAYSAIAYAMKEDGRTKFVTASIDLPIAYSQIAPARAAAKDAGLEDLGIIKIPAQGVTSYAAYAQQVKDKGADAVLVVLGNAGSQAFVKAAKAIGVDARLGTTMFSFGESEAKAIGRSADGYLVASPFPSTRDLDNPGIKRFNKELDAAGVSNEPALRRSAGLNAWLSMYAMAEVAKGIDGPVTAKSMTDALEASKPINLFDIMTWDPAKIGSAEYGDFKRFPPANYNILTFDNGTVIKSGLPPIEEPLKVSR